MVYVCLCVCTPVCKVSQIGSCGSKLEYLQLCKALDNMSYAKEEWRGNTFIHNLRSEVTSRKPGPVHGDQEENPKATMGPEPWEPRGLKTQRQKWGVRVRFDLVNNGESLKILENDTHSYDGERWHESVPRVNAERRGWVQETTWHL